MPNGSKLPGKQQTRLADAAAKHLSHCKCNAVGSLAHEGLMAQWHVDFWFRHNLTIV